MKLDLIVARILGPLVLCEMKSPDASQMQVKF